MLFRAPAHLFPSHFSTRRRHLSPPSFSGAASDVTFNNRLRRGATKRLFFGGKERQKNPNQKLPSRLCGQRQTVEETSVESGRTYLRVGGPSFVSNSKIGLDQLWSRCLLSCKGPPKKDQKQTISQRIRKGGGGGQINFRRFVPSSSSLAAATHADFFIRFLR